MPWIIERDGSVVRVKIACPVDDWDVLFAEIERRLRQERDVSAIELPERIPGASRIDADVSWCCTASLPTRPVSSSAQPDA
jgi:hypothetical protein